MKKLTNEQLENIKRNFETGSTGVLTAKAHDSWKPIILHLIDFYGPLNKVVEDGQAKAWQCKQCDIINNRVREKCVICNTPAT